MIIKNTLLRQPITFKKFVALKRAKNNQQETSDLWKIELITQCEKLFIPCSSCMLLNKKSFIWKKFFFSFMFSLQFFFFFLTVVEMVPLNVKYCNLKIKWVFQSKVYLKSSSITLIKILQRFRVLYWFTKCILFDNLYNFMILKWF